MCITDYLPNYEMSLEDMDRFLCNIPSVVMWRDFMLLLLILSLNSAEHSSSKDSMQLPPCARGSGDFTNNITYRMACSLLIVQLKHHSSRSRRQTPKLSLFRLEATTQLSE